MAKILIIDDERPVRSALRRILQSEGHDVLEAGNGAEAMSIVQGEQVEAVFTDIFMPEMDGIEFLLWVVERFPDRPVIAMSGGGSTPMGTALADARALGAARVMEKPLSPGTVQGVLNEVLPSA
jgi:CheY-like chemotaxis protein